MNTYPKEPFQELKHVAAAVKSKENPIHSYTLQITISAGRKLVGPVFLITQEPKGEFVRKARKKLA